MSYLLFADPSAKPVMEVDSLLTAISLSVHCGYGILHSSEYHPASYGVKSRKEREPETVNIHPDSLCCSNCHEPVKDGKSLTPRHSMKRTHFLCADCMEENEEPVYEK